MKCKKHLGDHSSAVGVCASCLRERLFVLIAAQARAQAELDCCEEDRTDLLPDSNLRLQQAECHQQHQHLPRSVSPPPFGRHRKSSSSSCDHPVRRPHRHRRRFFSTPQVGPTFSNNPAHHEPSDFPPPEKRPSKFSLIRLLFMKRSERIRDNAEPDPDPTSQPSSSSSIFGLWKKKQPQASSSVTYSALSGSACRRKCSVVVSNRGMSPAGGSEEDEDEEHDASPSSSGYSSEDCPNSWKRTPAMFATPRRAATTTTPHHHNHHPRSRSGFAFCLSPLVRMSPTGNWKNKGGMGIGMEAGYSGNLSDAVSFCKNRSRKLADFGRGAYRG